MHLQPQLTCTPAVGSKPLDALLFGSEAKVSLGAAGRPVRRPPGWGCPCSAAAPAPRPRQRLLCRQAGFTLDSDRGSHSLVGFLLESPEGREKGSEKGQLGFTGCPSPTPGTLRTQIPAWQSCCQGDYEDTALPRHTGPCRGDTGLLTQHRTECPIKHACFWTTKVLFDCQELPSYSETPPRKVKLLGGYAMRTRRMAEPGWVRPKPGCSGLPSVPRSESFQLEPLQEWAWAEWATQASALHLAPATHPRKAGGHSPEQVSGR